MNIFKLATMLDVDYLSRNLRKADIEELRALGTGTFNALANSLSLSDLALTAMVPEEPTTPALMFGVTTRFKEICGFTVIWLLATDAVKKHETMFLRYSRRWVKTLFKEYGPLGNWVHSKNYASRKWLGWLGFAPQHNRSVSKNGATFILYLKDA